MFLTDLGLTILFIVIFYGGLILFAMIVKGILERSRRLLGVALLAFRGRFEPSLTTEPAPATPRQKPVIGETPSATGMGAESGKIAARPPLRDPEKPTGEPWTKETAEGVCSTAYGLTVSIVWGDEIWPGVFKKGYSLSRAIAGIDRLDTQGGAGAAYDGLAQVSADERFMVIADISNCWIIDCRNNQIKHWEETDKRFHIETPICRGTTVQFCWADNADRCPQIVEVRINEDGELLNVWGRPSNWHSEEAASERPDCTQE